MKFVAAESVHKVPKTGGPKSAILRGGSRVVGSGRVGPGRVGPGRVGTIRLFVHTLNNTALRAQN